MPHRPQRWPAAALAGDRPRLPRSRPHNRPPTTHHSTTDERVAQSRVNDYQTMSGQLLHPPGSNLLDLVVICSEGHPGLNEVIAEFVAGSGLLWLTCASLLNDQWAIVLTEPTQQGYYDPNHTKLVILNDSNTFTQSEPSLAPDWEVDWVVPEFLTNSALSSPADPKSIEVLFTTDDWAGPDEDPTSAILLDQSSLARLGILSSDYVLVQSSNSFTNNRRLCRAYYNPKPKHSAKPRAIVSAALATNLNRGGHSNPSIVITSTSLSQQDVPIANSVTLSRVGSDLGLRRASQAEGVELLKDYFVETNPLLLVGDLISIQPSLDRNRFAQPDKVCLSFSQPAKTSHDHVWFVVSHVDDATQSIAPAGFRVDPNQTRILQVGLTHHPVPITQQHAAFLGSFGACGQDFFDYIQSFAGLSSADYNLKPTLLIQGRTGTGKATLARRAAQAVGLHLVEIDMFDLIGSSDLLSAAQLSASLTHAKLCQPGLLLIKNINALGNKGSVSSSGSETTQERKLVGTLNDFLANDDLGLIIVGTGSSPDSISPNIRALFSQSFNLEPPNQSNRVSILTELTEHLKLSLDISISDLAHRTAALVPRDLVNLVNRAKHAASIRLSSTIEPDHPSVVISCVDFEVGLLGVRASYSASIGAPKIPSVTWDQVGGLAAVKDEILETIQLPLSQPDLFGSGLKKRSGVLLYGPPGTGKTLLAKAVATTCSLNFFSVKGPELLDMYIGESEANVRRVFERAREAKPCVIFFDELDSVAPKRGNQGDSGGVMDRIVSQLLAELDGMSNGDSGGDVFVIGATNRPDLLDPALLRPGRFDRMVYLGQSQSHTDQLDILQALTRQFHLDDDVDLTSIAQQCSLNLTGADLYALCSDAMLKAMTSKATQIDDKLALLNHANPKPTHQITSQYYLSELATADDIQVLVSQDDFVQALAEVSPRSRI